MFWTDSQFIVGRRFYRAAWMGVKHGSLGMDALVRACSGEGCCSGGAGGVGLMSCMAVVL